MSKLDPDVNIKKYVAGGVVVSIRVCSFVSLTFQLIPVTIAGSGL